MKSLRNAALAFGCLLAFAAYADSYTYYVSPDGSDDNDGLSESNPFKTLGKMFGAANYHASDDVEMILLPGHYYLETTPSKLQVKSFVLRSRDGDPKDCVIDGQGLCRLVHVESGTGVKKFSGISFVNGCTATDTSSSTSGNGGAINFYGYDGNKGSVIITNCFFANCTAPRPDKAGSGGAIYAGFAGLEVWKCDFSNCVAAAMNQQNGGGAVCSSATASGAENKFYNCNFYDNCVTNCGNGGAYFGHIHTTYKPVASFSNCTFRGNYTLRNKPTVATTLTCAGGAVGGRIGRVEDCRFINNRARTELDPYWGFANKAYRADSGAMSVDTTYDDEPSTGPTGTIVRCTFVGNSADGVGGALSVSGSKVCIRDCTFSNNTSYAECPAVMTSAKMNVVEMQGCTLFANRVRGDYGADMTLNDVKSTPVMSVYAKEINVRHCRFERNYTTGIAILQLQNRTGQTPFSAMVDGCVFRRNVMERLPYSDKTVNKRLAGDGGAVVQTSPAASNVTVRGCLFVGNVATNFQAASVWLLNDLPNRVIENCTAVDNTVYAPNNSSVVTTALGGFCLADGGMSGCAVRNCLCSGNYGICSNTAENAAMKYVHDINRYTKAALTNCLFVSEQTNVQVGKPTKFGNLAVADGERGCIVGHDPKFVDADNEDYRLRKKSPAINAGQTLPWMRAADALDLTAYFPKEKHPVARVVGSEVDIGCYEYFPTLTGLMLLLK